MNCSDPIFGNTFEIRFFRLECQAASHNKPSHMSLLLLI